MLATEEMVAEPLTVKVCWWVRTLCRNDRYWVDAKDGRPSPNLSCLDGFEFVDRVGSNRSGDAVFALYFLVHLPCPPSLTLNRIGCGDGVEGRREGQSRRPPWGLTASGAPQAGTHDNDRWRAVGRLNLVQPAGVVGKPASSSDKVRHRGELMAAECWSLFTAGIRM